MNGLQVFLRLASKPLTLIILWSLFIVCMDLHDKSLLNWNL